MITVPNVPAPADTWYRTSQHLLHSLTNTMYQALAINAVCGLTLVSVLGLGMIDAVLYAPRVVEFSFAARGRRGGLTGSMTS